ncbi:endonuclease/exonuclease/phosphatase family protein [uncultured Parabacteroides sp.]|jgi:endonuclease/exonuclease/phosphatase family metal-dependent hydrolase|uniref:endonuclease/exonuclease/phosphatase family protein n=1 Tax=uncultured Parabacteroides sp. TaxID=512312 RepID=UPI002600704D|nr:endonuclease/exonuclease/phosphatase family protein [uncultured Parabacteroides sp.]
MKKILLSFLSLFLSVSFLSAKQPDVPLNVMTFNIRMDTKDDGANQWSNRKDLAAGLVKFHNVDIFGAQEVLNHQLNDLLTCLPEYAYVGVGREDGKTKGEYAAIFYKKDRFVLEDSGNFWLAEDINAVGKKGWDAACERVATWGIFKDKESGKKFFFLNTHLDHMGKVARHEGASLVLEEAHKLAKGLPVIVTGDFNATPDDDPIKVLTDKNDPRHIIHSREIASLKYGPEWTFHDYGRIPNEKREWIDYIFVKGDIKVLRNGVLTDTLNSLYPSDHCPVMATLIIQ